VTGILDAPKKTTVIRLRWPVVLICSYLLIHATAPWFSPVVLQTLLILYLISNGVLYFVREQLFDSSYFYVPLVLFDTFALTASLIISGQVGTMFYLTYFLIMVLCTIWQDIRGSIVVAVLITILYGFLLFKTTDVIDPSVYLRFCFLFVVSIFYGYIAHAVRVEKVLNEEAEASRLRSVSNLAAGVAHEVKNPLAILLQGVDYLSKKVAVNDQNIALVLDNMKTAVRRADSIVRGLMDFATLKQLNMVPEDLNSVINNSLLLVKNHLDRSHVEVIRDLAPSLPKASLDRNRIEQVFINLIMNALEAMPQGGKLWVRSYVDYPKPGSRMIVSEVENSGESINKDVLRHVFEPFVTTKRSMGGTGLGLSVVKNIIDMHTGNIQVSNREQGGVRVKLAFRV